MIAGTDPVPQVVLPSSDAMEMLDVVRLDAEVHANEIGRSVKCRHMTRQRARVLMTGAWASARVVYDMYRRGGDRGLLKLRVTWLVQRDAYAHHLWLTAHVRMYMWLESHSSAVPLVVYPQPYMCIGERSIPDSRYTLVNLQYRRCPGGSSKNPPPLEHILSKGLPKRCQIRELTRFLVKYCTNDPVFLCMFANMTACSLLGLYRGCKTRLPFGPMVQMLSARSMDAAARARFIEWLDERTDGDSARHANQPLCFYIVREYLCVAVSSIPALRSALWKDLEWEAFEQDTLFVMESVRKHVAASVDGWHGMNLQMCAIANQLVRELMKTRTQTIQAIPPVPGDSIQSILRGITNLRVQQIAWYRKQLAGTESILQVHLSALELLRAVPNDVTDVLPRMRAAGISNHAADCANSILRAQHAGQNPASMVKLLLKLLHTDLRAYAMFEHELRDARAQLHLKIHKLSECEMVAQTIAIDKAWEHAGGIAQCPHAGAFMVCLGCGEVKVPVSTSSHIVGKKKQVTPNVASYNVVIKYNDASLACERGHNSQSSASKAYKLMETESMELAWSLLPSKMESVITSLRCTQQPLAIIPLCGNLVEHAGAMYTACVECARTMTVDTDNRNLRCCWCSLARREAATDDSLRCALCNELRSTRVKVMLLDEMCTSVVRVAVLCHRCQPAMQSLQRGHKRAAVDIGKLNQRYKAQLVAKSLRLPGPPSAAVRHGAVRRY